MKEEEEDLEEEDLEDRDEDIRLALHEADQSSSSSTNPRYEKVDGSGSTSGDVGSSSDHLNAETNDNNKATSPNMSNTPTTVQVNITRDSQDRTSEEDEVEADN